MATVRSRRVSRALYLHLRVLALREEVPPVEEKSKTEAAQGAGWLGLFRAHGIPSQHEILTPMRLKQYAVCVIGPRREGRSTRFQTAPSHHVGWTERFEVEGVRGAGFSGLWAMTSVDY